MTCSAQELHFINLSQRLQEKVSSQAMTLSVYEDTIRELNARLLRQAEMIRFLDTWPR